MIHCIVEFNIDMPMAVDDIRATLTIAGAKNVTILEYHPDASEQIAPERLKFYHVFLGFKRWFFKPKSGIIAYVAATSPVAIPQFVGDILGKKLVLMKCNPETKKKELTHEQYLQELAICDFIEGIK